MLPIELFGGIVYLNMFLSDQIWGIHFGIFVHTAMRHFPCCLFKVVDIHRVVVGYSSTLGLCGANKHIHFMPHHIYKIIQAKVCIHLLLRSIFFIFASICVLVYLSISPYRYAAPPPQLAAIKGGRKSGFRTALHFSVDTKFHALR